MGHKGLQEVTGKYRGLEGVTGDYRAFEGVTRGFRELERKKEVIIILFYIEIVDVSLFACKQLHGFIRAGRGLQVVTRSYRGYILLS